VRRAQVVVREGDSHDPGPVIIRETLEWGFGHGPQDMLTVHQRGCADRGSCRDIGCVTIYLEDA
jgi:hypothetical protein